MASKRGQVRFFEAMVLRRLRLNDQQWIFSLLIRERGLLSVRWTLPKSERHKGEYLPGLFSHINACLLLHKDHLHKLCSFQTLSSSYRVCDVEGYQRLSLLARMTLLMARESHEEELFYALWLKALRLEEGQTGRLTLYSDIHYAHGTWPQVERCEHCHAVEAQKMDGPKLHCKNCANPLAETLTPSQIQFLSTRYRSRGQLELSWDEAKLLSNWLVRRLPENVTKDSIFKKLNRSIQ